MAPSVFPFRVESPFRLPLLLYGVTPARADVTVDDERVLIRFGPWAVDIPRSHISQVEVTGPFQWWKAIGIRMSLVDRGITFGTTAAAGACLQLSEPVSVRLGRRTVPLRHPGVTVTVADPGGLARLLAP
jgi:hypothetical protein